MLRFDDLDPYRLGHLVDDVISRDHDDDVDDCGGALHLC
jgi:hypothetical protein